MNLRKLGQSGISVHPIGIGCWAYGGGGYWGAQSQQDVDNVVHAALDKGTFLFDTAEMYNDGASEVALGLALKGRRDEAVLCSKISPSNARPADLRAHCEASLKRLGTDYLDIYMLHWPISPKSIQHFTDNPEIIANPPSVPDAFDTLMALRKEGKIREIGVSNFGVQQMKEALATGAVITVNELPYNLVSRAIEKEIAPFCQTNGITMVASMALQQGLLAGVYATVEEVRPHQAHSRHFAQERGQGTSRHYEQGAEAEVFEVVAQVRQTAQELGVSMAQLSIAWALAKPGIGCALVGARKVHQLLENLAAADLVLPDAVIRKLDEASEPVLQKLGYNPDYYENSAHGRVR